MQARRGPARRRRGHCRKRREMARAYAWRRRCAASPPKSIRWTTGAFRAGSISTPNSSRRNSAPSFARRRRSCATRAKFPSPASGAASNIWVKARSSFAVTTGRCEPSPTSAATAGRGWSTARAAARRSSPARITPGATDATAGSSESRIAANIPGSRPRSWAWSPSRSRTGTDSCS